MIQSRVRGIAPLSVAFLEQCEHGHLQARQKCHQRRKREIADQIRKSLEKNKKYTSDKAIAEVGGVSRATVERIMNARDDLSHVSMDSLISLAENLQISILIPKSLKRQLLLEELLPGMAQRRSAELDVNFVFDPKWLVRSALTRTRQNVELVVQQNPVVEIAVAEDRDAFEDWCAQASISLGDIPDARKLAALAAEYLHLRLRLNGFTRKLLVLSANRDVNIRLPDDLLGDCFEEETYPLFKILDLLHQLRKAAVLTRNQMGQDETVGESEFIAHMKKKLPRPFNRTETGVLLELIREFFGISVQDLRSLFENVGSLVLKSPLLSDVVIQLLKDGS